MPIDVLLRALLAVAMFVLIFVVPLVLCLRDLRRGHSDPGYEAKAIRDSLKHDGLKSTV